MVTPTAAAIIKAFALNGKLSEFKPEIVGMGAGSYLIPKTPGYLRISIGEGEII